MRIAASKSLRYYVYIRLSDCRLEEEEEYKIEDSPWMFQRVILYFWPTILQIIYKYERCKHTKIKSCYKNISCWFICSFDDFDPTNLMN